MTACSVQNVIAAHELGHAVLHEDDYYFFSGRNHCLRIRRKCRRMPLLVELLIPTNAILDNPGMTVGQLERLIGCTESY